MLKKLWTGEEEFDEVLQVSYHNCKKILAEKNMVDDLLAYIGMKI